MPVPGSPGSAPPLCPLHRARAAAAAPGSGGAFPLDRGSLRASWSALTLGPGQVGAGAHLAPREHCSPSPGLALAAGSCLALGGGSSVASVQGRGDVSIPGPLMPARAAYWAGGGRAGWSGDRDLL